MINKDLGISILSKVKNALDSVDMPFWITDGTLLGYHRDNGFILHDNDIDVATMIDDLSENFFQSLHENGLVVHSTFGDIGVGFEVSVKLRDEPKSPKCDIFFFYRGPRNTLWHAAWDFPIKGTNLRRMLKYSYEYFEIAPITFHGLELHAPVNIDEVLVTKYGPNWRTPNEKWDWSRDPKNIEITSIFTAV